MLTWEKIPHLALACCCLVGSKLCSTKRGNLIQLPLKLNSYIRLSAVKLQEGISQRALIIHILSLLPPFSLLVFLQVIKSQVVLCVREYQANFLMFCRHQSWSHHSEQMKIAAAIRSEVPQRPGWGRNIPHGYFWGSSAHSYSSDRALQHLGKSLQGQDEFRFTFQSQRGPKVP